jgi:outer membrane protein assembly factor BamD (BamD/ComL family)
MKNVLKVIMLVLMLAVFTACTDSARNLYETAQFEEKQQNYEHAAEIYEEIVTKYPASEYAPQAKERLEKIKGTTR